jgi:hypothetical protein
VNSPNPSFFYVPSSSLPVPSFTIGLLCLYYLFKNRKRSSLHATIIGFSIIISFFNLAAFVLRTASIITHTRFPICPQVVWSIDPVSVFSLPVVDFTRADIQSTFTKSLDGSTTLSVALLLIFLWFSDAFLVCKLHMFYNYFVLTISSVALPCLDSMDPKSKVHPPSSTCTHCFCR